MQLPVCDPAPVTRRPGPVSGTCFAGSHSPRSRPFAPPAPPPACRFCSQASQLLPPSLTSPVRSSSATAPHLPDAIRRRKRPRMGERSPGSRTTSYRTCQGLRPRRAVGTLALSRSAMSPSVGIKTSAPWIIGLRGSTADPRFPSDASPRPRERKRMAKGRCGSPSSIASDLHRLLLADPPAQTLSSTKKSARIDMISAATEAGHSGGLRRADIHDRALAGAKRPLTLW